MARDLTGIWTCNDGGIYFLQQLGRELWWLGLSRDGSLQNGLDFANVFHGIVDGASIRGSWADVPRGQNMGSGDLSLSVTQDANGDPAALASQAQTGGFAGTTWTFVAVASNLGFTDISVLFGVIVKNTYKAEFDLFSPLFFDILPETLGDNLEVAKDSVALFGTLVSAGNANGLPFSNSFPPSWTRNWDSFRAENTIWDVGLDQHDADMDFQIAVDPNFLPATLYVGMSNDHMQRVRDRLPGGVHPEMVMFAREDSGRGPHLPGWAEQGGNSILVNGRALNATCDISASGAATSVAGVVPMFGQAVRVTGVLSFDDGHSGGLELHPVYAVDFITGTARDDWSGAWGDADGSTYYIHQVFNDFWMYIGRPYRDLSSAIVFHGTLVPDRQMVEGNWATVPLGSASDSGEMFLLLDSGKVKIVIAGTTPLAGNEVRKLYDANGSTCPVIGDLKIQAHKPIRCEVQEVEGGTVTYDLKNAGLSALPGPTLQWSTTGGQIVGTSSRMSVQIANLPPAGTSVTVSIDVKASNGCTYHGERKFVTVTAAEAGDFRAWCVSRTLLFGLVRKFVPKPVDFEWPQLPPDNPAVVPSKAELTRIQEAVRQIAENLDRITK